MRLYDQRSRQGVTKRLVFTNDRREPQSILPGLTYGLPGLTALRPGLAMAGTLADVPQPELNPNELQRGVYGKVTWQF